ncbi:MAG: hypothetical protein ACOZNI_30945 [Myxococcota bacterium]
MRSLLVLALVACNKDKVPLGDDTGEAPFEPPPAVPYVAFVAAIDQSAGALKSTCEFGVEVYEGETLIGSSEGGGSGRQWTGVAVEETVLLTANALWQDCTNYDEGDGMLESNAFSAAAGNVFAFHYDGLETQFSTLVQGEDFEGGAVEAEFEEGYDPTALVASLPVTVESVDATHWRFAWEDTTSPVAVLALLSEPREYLSGAPPWISEPEWW